MAIAARGDRGARADMRDTRIATPYEMQVTLAGVAPLAAEMHRRQAEPGSGEKD